MNNFHRFQNFRQFSNLLNFVFANLIEKETHVPLLWNLSRNPPNQRRSKLRAAGVGVLDVADRPEGLQVGVLAGEQYRPDADPAYNTLVRELAKLAKFAIFCR